METINKKLILAGLLLGTSIYHTNTHTLSETLFAAIKKSFTTCYDFVIQKDTILIDNQYLIPTNFFGGKSAVEVVQKGSKLEIYEKNSPKKKFFGTIFLDKDSPKLAKIAGNYEPYSNIWRHLGEYYINEDACNVMIIPEEVYLISEGGESFCHRFEITIEKRFLQDLDLSKNTDKTKIEKQ